MKNIVEVRGNILILAGGGKGNGNGPASRPLREPHIELILVTVEPDYALTEESGAIERSLKSETTRTHMSVRQSLALAAQLFMLSSQAFEVCVQMDHDLARKIDDDMLVMAKNILSACENGWQDVIVEGAQEPPAEEAVEEQSAAPAE